MKGWPYSEAPVKPLRNEGHAENCDGPTDWHNPVNGHCADCGCLACHLAVTR